MFVCNFIIKNGCRVLFRNDTVSHKIILRYPWVLILNMNYVEAVFSVGKGLNENKKIPLSLLTVVVLLLFSFPKNVLDAWRKISNFPFRTCNLNPDDGDAFSTGVLWGMINTLSHAHSNCILYGRSQHPTGQLRLG